MPNLNEVIKQISIQALQASNPSEIYFGTVISISPLQIRLDQKAVLTSKQLVLSSLVQDFTIEMTVDHQTEMKNGGSGEDAFAAHYHDYKGKKYFIAHLGLLVGEKVILLQVQGGQKFVVLDRVR